VIVDAVVTGIGVCTPWGDAPELIPAATERPGPLDDAWFDTAAQLGPRGYKYLPQACRYLLAAGRRAITSAGSVDTGLRGIAIGTNHATSAQNAAMNDTVARTAAYDLSPSTAPYFAVNVFASRLAIEHDCTAFCLTVTTPLAAGLESLQTGVRALACGRADTVLAGATEHRLDGGFAEPGAAVLVFETRAAAVERGARIFGTCHTGSAYAPAADHVKEAVAAKWSELAADGLPVTVFLDETVRTSAIEDALREFADHVDVVPVRAGSAGPVWEVARLLAGGAAHRVVAVAGRGGILSLTAVRPAVSDG
jgi:3-oxoacyl-[acyl-carrier-protein] synthase II